MVPQLLGRTQVAQTEAVGGDAGVVARVVDCPGSHDEIVVADGSSVAL